MKTLADLDVRMRVYDRRSVHVLLVIVGVSYIATSTRSFRKKMEFRFFVLCASLGLLLASVFVISSPVVYLEKNGGSKTRNRNIDVGDPWTSCSE